MSDVQEVTITLVGVKKNPGDQSNNMNASNNDGRGDDEQGDDFIEDNFVPPVRENNKFKGAGPGNFRNRHYQNAYGNYRGGYGPQGEFGPPMGPPPELGFGPMPRYGPGPNFPMGPNFGWGRGFGPDGPPTFRVENKVLRFLSRCGVAKENLRNLPRALLMLIEPTYCGLCGISLDTLSMSRMHYVSKNHLKNQRKWLSNQQMGGPGQFQQRKEPPVKSRDLYCELCDVHITSKSHADTHYAGKPHRAIVEGRKLAKNTFLLQRGMENRLEMLIRREKKHLKSEENGPKEETKSKAISPELYCDICKTSVTCSEQMTMHLNGKKHLTKEKQHILKMMTGQADNQPAAVEDEDMNENAEQEQEEGDEEVAENEAGGEENQDFDWENGSGNWDEPAANNE
ncbi:uncharacterized protein LOC106138728 isoform X2 [Amyelois transitella]|uniref:uncharacterized protein LOC106138728 isoform X2 n=1 Tax=Amyelois transitella TaxID=680683 RepID=UPI00067E1B06|nr:uncharacterized protein LOC106138728 isoform X2 [Amyelois transitella]